MDISAGILTFATTYSLSNGVTDSAAGGTALAVGKKTKNGVIGMDSSATVPFKSIAYAAKEKGLKVGITTSVSIDHATPASFYAHQASRNMYYEIAQDLIKSNFDFFAGAGFLKPNTTYDKKEAPSIFPQIEEAGYTFVKGYDNFKQQELNGQKLILTDVEGSPNTVLPFAIDKKETDLKLAEITTAAIASLSANNDKGFFLMVEGGKIDHSSHANDAATTVEEVLDFNDAVKVAYDFYKQHPNETLIVVAADHETGGLIIGNGSYGLSTSNLQYQKMSQGELSRLITELRDTKPNATWDDVKTILRDNLGLWAKVKVSEKEEQPIYEAYQASFINHKNETKKTLYASDNKIAALGIALLNKKSSLGWASTSHSATAIPVFAIGVGAEAFNRSLDNTEIPKKMAQAAGLNL
jgi:alkaline phosphatase